MKKKKISRLLQRYLSGHQEGRDAYFDADEVDELLDSFEESDDYTYYDEVLALGLRLHPGNPDLLIKQCRSYVYNEDYDNALALIESIAESDNENLDMLRLECYVMQDSYDKVIEYIEQLIADKCEYLEAIFEYIAPILGDIEKTREAHDFINRGLMLFPDNLILKDELCYTLELEGNIKKAIVVCNELIDKNPYSNDYWYTLGRLYSIDEDYEKAIEAFDFALTCNEADEELKMLKAYCLYMNQNYEKAIEVYREFQPGNEEYTSPLIAECQIKLGNYEEAYAILKEIFDQEPDLKDATLYINLARCCAETGREKEATEVLEKAARQVPDHIHILSLLALNYMDNGDERKAMETTEILFNALDRAEEKDQEDIESLCYAGHYLFVKGKIDKALLYYNKLLEANPNRPNIHLYLAIAYLVKGDTEHFREHYRQISAKELTDYLKNIGFDYKGIAKYIDNKPIPPEDLVKEFLKNKDNKN